MNFENLLQRANLNSIESFLLYGIESYTDFNEKTYSERLNEARKNATEFFQSKYTDIDEYDKITGYFDEQVSVFEDVYFELGLITGSKIGFQISERLKNL